MLTDRFAVSQRQACKLLNQPRATQRYAVIECDDEKPLTKRIIEVKTLYIEPGSPWENGYVESFNGKLADELLEREVFDTLYEATVLIERWRKQYNTIRPHCSLGVSSAGSASVLG